MRTRWRFSLLIALSLLKQSSSLRLHRRCHRVGSFQTRVHEQLRWALRRSTNELNCRQSIDVLALWTLPVKQNNVIAFSFATRYNWLNFIKHCLGSIWGTGGGNFEHYTIANTFYRFDLIEVIIYWAKFNSRCAILRGKWWTGFHEMNS